MNSKQVSLCGTQSRGFQKILIKIFVRFMSDGALPLHHNISNSAAGCQRCLIIKWGAFGNMSEMKLKLNPGKVSDNLYWALQTEAIAIIVALLTDKSNVVYHKAFGWEKVAGAQKKWLDSLLHIASITKFITSLGVMQLLEKGLIRLDNAIRNRMRDLALFGEFTNFDDRTGKIIGPLNIKSVLPPKM